MVNTFHHKRENIPFREATMPTTRSMRALSTVVSASAAAKPRPSRSRQKSKRTIEEADASEPSPSPQIVKKARVTAPSTVVATQALPSSETNQVLPAVLGFSFEAAKQHLINADARFEGIFKQLPCRPFEQLERVDPFRTLVTSILGQQISWLAARSITHRFIRLYFPSLPEKPPAIGSGDPKVPEDVFPTAAQVGHTDVATLKTAGLSTRKAEYVLDLASRFADGRLSAQKLVEADDEELARLLIEVRGIGRWTVDMFAIFSLRRPDILPVGDLGIQRGVVRWFLSLHSPKDAVTVSPKKVPAPPSDDPTVQAGIRDEATSSSIQLQAELNGRLPSITPAFDEPGVSSVSPMPVTPVKGRATFSLEGPPESPDKAGLDTGSMATLPEPFTPSINRTLYSESFTGAGDVDGDAPLKKDPPSLPEGLTVMSLKARLNGKKTKGALLTPKEMEDLTEAWRPYRSLGVYYMWALVEETPSKPSKAKPSPSK
ncbi:DNA glycosylase [Gautieria morchelliformis]|nr:DNA glycosylase [Gautieria morchelliformis]